MDFDAQYRQDLINFFNDKQSKDPNSSDFLLTTSQKLTQVALRVEQPAAPKELPRPKALEEDEYFKRLELIIARDFFPSTFVPPSSSEEEQRFLQMSVDEFQRRYTSEDNASFRAIHDRDRAQFLKRIDFMFRQ